MHKNLIVGLLSGLVVLFVVSAAVFVSGKATTPRPIAAVATAERNPGYAAPAPGSLEARVGELERALAVEREARQLLEDELFQLLRQAPPPVEVATTDEPAATAAVRQRQAERRRQTPGEGRLARMVAAGMDTATAQWILSREAELQYEALQIRYEAGRNGSPEDFFRTRADTRQMLRDEIGDTDFERYLSANGMGTNIVVSAVLDASPARSAGLRPGDRITRYDGQRVFSVSDMSRKILEGAPGENVVLEFERDGIPMQVLLPRGPVGISGG